MKAVLTVILIIAAIYWLSGKGIVSVDSVKAKSCIEDVQNKLKGIASEDTDMTSVNHEVGKLCTELRDLSERALSLRQKLMANVVESTSSDQISTSRSSRYSRR